MIPMVSARNWWICVWETSVWMHAVRAPPRSPWLTNNDENTVTLSLYLTWYTHASITYTMLYSAYNHVWVWPLTPTKSVGPPTYLPKYGHDRAWPMLVLVCTYTLYTLKHRLHYTIYIHSKLFLMFFKLLTLHVTQSANINKFKNILGLCIAVYVQCRRCLRLYTLLVKPYPGT